MMGLVPDNLVLVAQDNIRAPVAIHVSYLQAIPHPYLGVDFLSFEFRFSGRHHQCARAEGKNEFLHKLTNGFQPALLANLIVPIPIHQARIIPTMGVLDFPLGMLFIPSDLRLWIIRCPRQGNTLPFSSTITLR